MHRSFALSLWTCALATALSLAGPSVAVASGQRGLELTEAVISEFVVLKPERAVTIKDLRYIGSSKEWHLFFHVETTVSDGGRGMPFDHLTTYRTPVAEMKIENGWTINFTGEYIEASGCPRIRPVEQPEPASGPATVTVTVDSSARERCGT